MEHICLEHGIGTGTLRDRMRRWKWTRRRQPISPEGPPSAPPCEPALSLSALPESGATAPSPSVVLPTSSAPRDPEQIARQLQAAIAHVLPAIETTLGKLGSSAPREMEGAARALAALTRTLRELNALLNRYPPPTEDEEAQLQALRAGLACKIDGIIAQRPQRAAAEAQSAET